MRHAVETEIADGLDHSGQNKSEGEDQSSAIVRAPKANECVGRIAEAKKCATDFKVEIGLGSSGVVLRAQIKDGAKIEQKKGGNSRDVRSGRPFPENPDEFSPISHEFPQLPKKTGQSRKNARWCPFYGQNLMPEVIDF